jgi:hypothetical protein
LEALSSALETLIKHQAVEYLKAQVIQNTVLQAIFNFTSPTSWLQIGQIIGEIPSFVYCDHVVFMIGADNPWMNAKALATKAGRVLGALLAEHVLGSRPVTLVGYSLGSLVIFEALQHLASLPPSQTMHIIQDVYLFGSPVTTDEVQWKSVRRIVAGRLINGYCDKDYILGILCRIAKWGVAGLREITVDGVENVRCVGVEGHLKWRGMIGRCLEDCGAPGTVDEEVKVQVTQILGQITQLEPRVDEANAGKIIDKFRGQEGSS